jgi:hypothetical protein
MCLPRWQVVHFCVTLGLLAQQAYRGKHTAASIPVPAVASILQQECRCKHTVTSTPQHAQGSKDTAASIPLQAYRRLL